MASVVTVVVIMLIQTVVVRRVGREGRAAALGAGLAWMLWGGACAGLLLGLSDLLFWVVVRPAIQFLLVMALAFGDVAGRQAPGRGLGVGARRRLAAGRRLHPASSGCCCAGRTPRR